MATLSTFAALLNTMIKNTVLELLDIYIAIANGTRVSSISQSDAFQILSGVILEYIKMGQNSEAELLLARISSNIPAVKLGKLALFNKLKELKIAN